MKRLRISKVYYRPIEAAIRWSGLTRREAEILERLKNNPSPSAEDLSPWPSLQRAAERIYDAIRNQELRTAVEGVTTDLPAQVGDPQLMIRHIDLREWMIRYYPGERPSFLFSRIERNAAHPHITLATLHALTFQRDALLSKIELQNLELQTLRSGRSTLQRQSIPPASPNSKEPTLSPCGEIRTGNDTLSSRAEATYLHIVGGLLRLLLGSTPSGQPYSRFKTQESIVSALIAHCGEFMGITERTLHAKFAAAKRKLDGG